MDKNKVLYFSKSKRRAVLFLCCLGVVVLSVFVFFDAKRGEEECDSNISERKNELREIYDDRFGSNENVRRSFSRNNESGYEKGKRVSGNKIALREFDPNTIDSLSLISFGLKEWKVKNFIHYRSAGAVFRNADDLLRTYGWTEYDVEKLRAYVKVDKKYLSKRNSKLKGSNNHHRDNSIFGNGENRDANYRQNIDKSEAIKKVPYVSNKFDKLTKVNVNVADSALLSRIPGMGEKRIRALLQRREALGGYVRVEQLMEVPMFLEDLLEWFEINDENVIRKININTASFRELNKHPYIGFETTKVLMQYRHNYGKVESLDAMVKTGIISVKEAERLAPYVCF